MFKDEVRELLTGLGTSSVEIAQALENKGIKGYKGEPTSCPLAQLLYEQFPGWEFVVYNDNIIAHKWDETISAFDRREVSHPTEAIGHFIIAMDQGHFPALVKEFDV